MFSYPIIRFSYALTIFISLTYANWFDNNVFLRSSYGRQIPKRQINPAVSLSATTNVPLGTGPIVPAEVTTSATSSVTTPSPTISSTSHAPDISTSEPESTTTDNLPDTQSANPTPSTKTSPSTSTRQTAATSTNGGRSSVATTARPSSTISQSIELITSVVTVSGSVVTTVSSSTTEIPISQPTGDEASPDQSTSSSGMTSKTRNIVIGVVAGIGGAALLAGLSIVAWRIWGRKKDIDEDHGLMDFRTGSPGQEKALGAGNVRSANPFQSTLENYHNPTRVNASSNF